MPPGWSVSAGLYWCPDHPLCSPSHPLLGPPMPVRPRESISAPVRAPVRGFRVHEVLCDGVLIGEVPILGVRHRFRAVRVNDAATGPYYADDLRSQNHFDAVLACGAIPRGFPVSTVALPGRVGRWAMTTWPTHRPS